MRAELDFDVLTFGGKRLGRNQLIESNPFINMGSLRRRVTQVHDGTLHLAQVVGVKVTDLILGPYLEKQLRVLGQGIRSPVPLGGADVPGVRSSSRSK